jgi:hypothetical protein
LVVWSEFAVAILLPVSVTDGSEPGLKSADDPASVYDFVSAYRRFRDELAEHPTTEIGPLLHAAQLARRAEKLDDAERFLTEVGRSAPTDGEAFAFEQLLLRAQRGHAAEVRPKLADRLGAGGPDAELTWEALGRGYLHAYRLPEAKECFSALIRIRPDSLPGYLGRAETFRQWPLLFGGAIPAAKAIPDLERFRDVADAEQAGGTQAADDRQPHLLLPQ